MRVACVTYRNWALAIYEELARDAGNEMMIVRNRDEFSEDAERGACGKPVVASGSGEVADAVIDGEAGVLVPEWDGRRGGRNDLAVASRSSARR